MDPGDKASSVLRFVSERRREKADSARNNHASHLKLPVPDTALSKRSPRFSPPLQQKHAAVPYLVSEAPEYQAQCDSHVRDVFDTDAEDAEGSTIISTRPSSPVQQFERYDQQISPPVESGTRRDRKATDVDVYHELKGRSYEHAPKGSFAMPNPRYNPAQGAVISRQQSNSLRNPFQAAQKTLSSHDTQELNMSRSNSIGPLARVDKSPSPYNTPKGPAQHGKSHHHGRFSSFSSQPTKHDSAIQSTKPRNRVADAAPQVAQEDHHSGTQHRLISINSAKMQETPDRKHSDMTAQSLKHSHDDRTTGLADVVRNQDRARPSDFVTRFEDETDPEITDNEGRMDSSEILAHQDRSRKRRRSLDYSIDTLAGMRYEQLRDEPFDYDPKKQSHELPAKLVNGSTQEKLDHIFSWRNSDQEGKQRDLFFASLSLDEHAECGDLIVQKFSMVLNKFKEMRKEKRGICKDFEREVERRQEVVESKRGAIQAELKAMHTKGKDIVPRTTNIRSESPAG